MIALGEERRYFCRRCEQAYYREAQDRELVDHEIDAAAERLRIQEAARERVRAEAERPRLMPLDRDALDYLPEPVEMLAGVLPARGGLALLSGSRELGKSLLALSWSGAVSGAVAAWQGHTVPEPGPVLYVAQEGFHGVPRRIWAWEEHNDADLTAVHWLNAPLDLKKETHADELAKVATDLGAIMIVLDSARATGAGREDTEDMGCYVRGLERLREATGALALVLHNSGWDGSRERGSTLLPDAMDTTLHLEGDPRGVRTLRHRKHRDGDEMTPLALEFTSVAGTGSGVLVPATAGAVLGEQLQLRSRLLAVLSASPGSTTQGLADSLGISKDRAARLLSGMREQVRDRSTTRRREWVLTEEGEAELADDRGDS